MVYLGYIPQVWDLHLNDPECRGVQIGDNYVFSIKTNLTDCGTLTVNILHTVYKCFTLLLYVRPLK